MAVLQELATETRNNFVQVLKANGIDRNVGAIDWDAILAFIRELVEILGDCGLFAQTPTDRLVEICHCPGWWGERRAERKLKGILGTRQRYREIGPYVLDATRKTFSTMDAETLESAMEEL